MTPLDRIYFRLHLKRELLDRCGTAFQDLFASIMEIAHPGDFVRVAPWGNVGDLKSDGFLPSESSLFQCYAPREMTAAKAKDKVKTDFAGACEHWGGKFSRWIFVHNSAEGVPAPVHREIEKLRNGDGGVELGVWGHSEIEDRLLRAPRDRIVRILGEPFGEADLADVGFADIKLIVDHLVNQPAPADESIKPVSANKLAANALSKEVADFLLVGMRRSQLVGQFFRQYHDTTLGDRAAESFRAEYVRRKAEGLLPDRIFFCLRTFATGPLAQDARTEASVLSVLAYLFEQCDIFEPPLEGDS